ncbi:uncharacterized protein K452DRAFT_310597 [Aplosporella prunicola CBS 121167]|uniref:Kri1-like C-terminal domain-containing protein n=1 Tax=Aplosporella prunicola CBS 121167 TaxID=1176127 RepID=A0A6A6BB38_9PEZI|nr:uncharacterized protein K452DRAFT_310597 [Aplosporella prunicola CBS 121167]KAF2139691.1 hypothetical protein K452DRAFT_310597 [Aplosporella prunicola CBS 121167]
MDDSDASSDEGEHMTLKVNEEFARRFEHNKKREEKQRLEEKYGKNTKTKARADDDASGSDEDSSSDESEDDAGILATVDLDAEISATLNAIRTKDPALYDANHKFYSEFDPEKLQNDDKKEKPMYLRDYHRKNLLEGKMGREEEEEDENAPPKTYVQEQEALKKNLVKSMHEAKEEGSDEEGSDEDDFLVKKPEQKYNKVAEEPKKPKVELDIENADKDPENFLSNFLAARAWATDKPAFAPLESDDDEDDMRAEEFEHAYNMRFEDPSTANEKLMTHARDAAAKYSVRREEVSGRKKQREKERSKKDAEKAQRDEEKARLRKLKIDEMEEKVAKIKEAAGITGRDFNMDEWAGVLEEDWDDNDWDKEMQKRFGEDYYAENDMEAASSDEEAGKKKKKPKKPKWDDDIDIKDLVPDFEDEEAKPSVALSDDDDGEEEDGGVELPDAEADSDDDEGSSSKKKKSTKKARKEATIDAKRNARRERRLIETLVDQNLEVAMAEKEAAKAPARFRYRETSPTTFGLTARDILLADDAALNQFAGLKKMAAWRDPEKKRKDKKNLGKKARLRSWRKETFGDEEGPKGGFADYVLGKYGEKGVPVDGGRDAQMKDVSAAAVGEGGVDIREGGKKKKRSKKRKAAAVEEE